MNCFSYIPGGRSVTVKRPVRRVRRPPPPAVEFITPLGAVPVNRGIVDCWSEDRLMPVHVPHLPDPPYDDVYYYCYYWHSEPSWRFDLDFVAGKICTKLFTLHVWHVVVAFHILCVFVYFVYLPCDIKYGMRNLPVTTRLFSSSNVLPSNGKAPHTKAYKTTPRLHISALGPSYSKP
uniref:Uncharacterized protein n=1 Tax=Glossina pallidipes TaxID=7398 RepID=A0A1A9ZY17_GLOPL